MMRLAVVSNKGGIMACINAAPAAKNNEAENPNANRACCQYVSFTLAGWSMNPLSWNIRAESPKARNRTLGGTEVELRALDR